MGLQAQYVFICDSDISNGCGASAVFATDSKMRAIRAARETGWAVSRDRRKCYCPEHAPTFRGVGCKGGFWRKNNKSR